MMPAHSTRPLAIALGGMVALAAGMGIGRFVYTPILPAMAAGLGLSKSQAGLIASANFLGYLAGALSTAAPDLPGGRRLWLLGALCVGAATLALMGATGSLPVFLVLRFVSGVASAFVLVFGSALVVDQLAAAGRTDLAPMHFAGVGVGIAVSAVLVDGLEAVGLNWQGLWFWSGVISALVVPIAARLIGRTPSHTAHRGRDSTDRLPRGLGALSLCHGLFGFGYVITATFLVAVVRATAPTVEPIVWVFVGLAAAPSTALWGLAGARLGALRAYALACALEAVGVAVGGVWPRPAGAAIAAVLLGGTFMGITALGFVAARDLAPAQQRRSFAFMTAAFGLGQILGPLVAGVMLDRTGSFAPPSLLAAALLAVAAAIAGSRALSFRTPPAAATSSAPARR